MSLIFSDLILSNLPAQATPQHGATTQNSSDVVELVADTNTTNSLFASFRAQEPMLYGRAEQLNRYLDLSASSISTEAVNFWLSNQQRFPDLSRLALSVLSVPATSAPVERVFSSGGLFMRPHRSRLHDSTLSQLVFAKCNGLFLC